MGSGPNVGGGSQGGRGSTIGGSGGPRVSSSSSSWSAADSKGWQATRGAYRLGRQAGLEEPAS
eukprot:7336236-Lingulodinium_polyedra.AAC.1